MEHPKSFNLEIDRRLMKNNFNGYKLSLENIPIIKIKLQSPVLRAKASTDQYSYLHTEMFIMYNHLTRDISNECSYFVTNDGVCRALCSENDWRIDVVYKMPSIADRKLGDYNITFRFVSDKFCVLCDGSKEVSIIDTGHRRNIDAEWKEIFKTKISEYSKGFILRDARLDLNADNKEIISCIFQHITGKEMSFKSELFWGILSRTDDQSDWKYEEQGVLHGRGLVNYCFIEPKGQGIFLSSNKEVKFTTEELKEDPPSDEETDYVTDEIPLYTWSQSDDDITVEFPNREGTEKNDYTIECTKSYVMVKYKEDVLLNGKLFSQIDPNLTTWTLANDILQLIVIKRVDKLKWEYFVKDLKIFDLPKLQPIPNLEEQLEECDNPNIGPDEHFIERIDLITKNVSHRVTLGGRAPLFYTDLNLGYPHAIGIREDVDVCLWQYHVKDSEPDGFQVRHEGTFHALGYIQASKQYKKFMNCSFESKYSIICESIRNIFIYKEHDVSMASLRHRYGQKVLIGKQHVLSLEEEIGEILGMVVDHQWTTLLAANYILFLRIISD